MSSQSDYSEGSRVLTPVGPGTVVGPVQYSRILKVKLALVQIDGDERVQGWPVDDLLPLGGERRCPECDDGKDRRHVNRREVKR
jgi:hypothetical protein